MANVLRGDWNKAKKVLAKQDKVRDAIRRAVRQEAEHFLRMVKRGIQDRAPGGKEFKGLAPLTVWHRTNHRGNNKRMGSSAGANKPLIDSGALYSSIKLHDDSTNDGFFVGIVYGDVHPNTGVSMVSVGLKHEEGWEMVVDMRQHPAALKFFFAMLRESGLMDEHRISVAQSRLRAMMAGGSSLFYLHIPARPFLQPVMEEYTRDLAAATQRITESVGRSLREFRDAA